MASAFYCADMVTCMRAAAARQVRARPDASGHSCTLLPSPVPSSGSPSQLCQGWRAPAQNQGKCLFPAPATHPQFPMQAQRGTPQRLYCLLTLASPVHTYPRVPYLSLTCSYLRHFCTYLLYIHTHVSHIWLILANICHMPAHSCLIPVPYLPHTCPTSAHTCPYLSHTCRTHAPHLSTPVPACFWVRNGPLIRALCEGWTLRFKSVPRSLLSVASLQPPRWCVGPQAGVGGAAQTIALPRP